MPGFGGLSRDIFRAFMGETYIIRRLSTKDLAAAMALKEAAGWNQTERDWELLLRLQPDGCFALEAEGQVVASATAFCYGRELAWIGMVLTLPAFRGRGFGGAVFGRTVDYCREKGISCVKLDATTMGEPLYARAGFVAEYPVERWGGTAPSGQGSVAGVDPLDRAALAGMIDRDRAAFGVGREAVLEGLLGNSTWMGAIRGSRGFTAYAMARPGSKALYFGPCVADRQQDAASLLGACMAANPGSPVFVDVPVPNEAARELLRSRGFEVRRTLLRMCLGPNGRPGEPGHVFGLAGFEFG